MRKLCWFGAAAVVLGTTAGGIYLLPRPAVTLPPLQVQEAEEQEFSARPLPPGPERFDMLVEPIVVERLVTEEITEMAVQVKEFHTGSFLVAQSGPVVNSNAGLVGSLPTLTDQAPRPDGTPQRRMPYADEETDATPMSARFWREHLPPERTSNWFADTVETLWGLMCGVAPEPIVRPTPTTEEEAEVKVPPSGPEPPVSEPEKPVYDYHYHHPSCPYTGRCPAPYPAPYRP